MPDAPKQREKTVLLKISDEAADFPCQMYFNTYSVERFETGYFLRFAYVAQAAGEVVSVGDVVPIFFSIEGLTHLKQATEASSYLQNFKPATGRPMLPIPPGRQTAPLFANHARLARTGGTAEAALYTVPIHSIASVLQGKAPTAPIRAIPVALLHSEGDVHEHLILSLLSQL